MTYPITIVDNFFEDPDAIVEMAMGMKYYNPNTQVTGLAQEPNNFM